MGGTITKSVTNYGIVTTVTATVTDYTLAPDSNGKLAIPRPKVQAKGNWGTYDTNSTAFRVWWYYLTLKYNSTTVASYSSSATSAWTSKNTYVTADAGTATLLVSASTLFNSNNKTTKTIALTPRINCAIAGNSGDWSNAVDDNFGTQNITLNAPPTITCGVPTYATPQYAGLGAYSVPVTTASALYGGDVSSITVTVGADSTTQTYSSSTVTNQTISVVPTIAGTYTPTITVTDSRGQSTTETLTPITVNAYIPPSLSFNVIRTNSSGVSDDEGTYGLAAVTIDYTSAIATLTAPTVSAVDSSGTAVATTTTWYSAYSSSTGVSSAISDWSTIASGATVYGLINGSFSGSDSYQITITETDNQSGTSLPVTQTLSTGFFTIDFQAGGKEIAFGGPANDNLSSYPDGLFKCDMDAIFNGTAQFKDNASTVRLLFDFIYPVGSYYETSDTSFDPNTTWGGTWILETEGQVHVSGSASGTYQVNGALTDTTDGGAATVTLTTQEMPSHSHVRNANGGYNSNFSTGSGRTIPTNNSTGDKNNLRTANEGGGQAHNNMQPYIVIYRWHRTA